MEALAGVSVGLLTIYDMCKAVDRGMVMSDIRLLEKQGALGALAPRGSEREAAWHGSEMPVACRASAGMMRT